MTTDNGFGSFGTQKSIQTHSLSSNPIRRDWGGISESVAAGYGWKGGREINRSAVMDSSER